ncbi:unnamed protein product [Danaus chrysippus]|uniref:(African queen) hypothetical protein n=1 Tax=Danaus chrysippus TaxID=151541 RepID=A0A8J2W0Z0_9NEOP|nr:unnamed protein product [Danaus chrysippus]
MTCQTNASRSLVLSPDFAALDVARYDSVIFVSCRCGRAPQRCTASELLWAVELELDTYAAIIAEMGHVAQSMASGGHPEGGALVTRHDQLAGSLARLQRLAASRQAALMESVCSESWQRLVEQIQSCSQRLAAAAEIHRFHRDAGDLLARARDRRAHLAPPPTPRDLRAATALLRDHDAAENDMVAIDAQT